MVVHCGCQVIPHFVPLCGWLDGVNIVIRWDYMHSRLLWRSVLQFNRIHYHFSLDKVVDKATSSDYATLSSHGIVRARSQNCKSHLQPPEASLNHVLSTCVIHVKILFPTLELVSLPPNFNVVSLTSIWGKQSQFISVTGIDEVVMTYKPHWRISDYGDTSVGLFACKRKCRNSDIPYGIRTPWGLTNALRNTLESVADPSQPDIAYMKRRFRLQPPKTFVA